MGRSRNSCAVWFHTTVTVVLFISGALLLSLGVWQLVTSFGGLSRLTFPPESRFYATVSASSGLINTVLAPMLMLATVCGFLALMFPSFRFVYALMAAISFIILCFISVVCWVLAVTYASQNLANVLRAAWNITPPETLCKIEAARACRSFQSGCFVTTTTTSNINSIDSASSMAEKCASGCIPAVAYNGNNGCYDALTNLLFKVALPVALTSGIAAFVVAADIFAVFSL